MSFLYYRFTPILSVNTDSQESAILLLSIIVANHCTEKKETNR